MRKTTVRFKYQEVILDPKDTFERKEKIKTFKIGSIWDYPQWEINYNVRRENPDTICHHMVGPLTKRVILRYKHSVTKEVIVDSDKEIIYYFVPRIVVGINEGGMSSTGICLDCILEKAKGSENV